MRPNTASIAEMVSAAVFPVSRGASVTRDLYQFCFSATHRADSRNGAGAHSRFGEAIVGSDHEFW